MDNEEYPLAIKRRGFNINKKFNCEEGKSKITKEFEEGREYGQKMEKPASKNHCLDPLHGINFVQYHAAVSQC